MGARESGPVASPERSSSVSTNNLVHFDRFLRNVFCWFFWFFFTRRRRRHFLLFGRVLLGRLLRRFFLEFVRRVIDIFFFLEFVRRRGVVFGRRRLVLDVNVLLLRHFVVTFFGRRRLLCRLLLVLVVFLFFFFFSRRLVFRIFLFALLRGLLFGGG